jgi:hypothetical protein
LNGPTIGFTRMRSCAATPVSSVLDEWIVAEAIVGCSAELGTDAIVAVWTPA